MDHRSLAGNIEPAVGFNRAREREMLTACAFAAFDAVSLDAHAALLSVGALLTIRCEILSDSVPNKLLAGKSLNKFTCVYLHSLREIGRASCRERVDISVEAV